MALSRTREPEDVYYYVTPEWYKGKFPTFYDTAQLPWTKLLEDNWQPIKEEVEAYYRANAAVIKPNFTPYSYKEAGWKTVNLYSYFFRYRKACEAFPKLDAIVRQIPGMSLTQIGILEPHTRIKPHFGDTNVVIRCHLGLVVPGALPELGLKVKRQSVTWEEGKTFAFCITHRHYAWNNTDQLRLVLLVDVFREEYLHRRYAIAGKALASMAMKLCATKVPILKKLPAVVTKAIHEVAGLFFHGILLGQRVVGRVVERFIPRD